MKIQFLKQHLDNKEGDKVELEDGIANYLIKMGAAKAATAKEAKDKPKEKKQLSDNPGAIATKKNK